MKFTGVLIFCCLVSLIGRAQINHFIYIQTENKQPFYVKLKERLYSSSAQGYLVVPKLPEGEYNITIGFPKNEFPPKQLNITVGKNDEGYLYRQTMNKEWALYNLYTMQMVSADTKVQAVVKEAKPVVRDTIASVLTPATEDVKPASETIKDESIPAVVKQSEEIKTVKEPVQPVIDTVVKIPATTIIESIPQPKKEVVARISQTTDAGNAFVSYAVYEASGTDTVDIIIEPGVKTVEVVQPLADTQKLVTSSSQPATSNKPAADSVNIPSTSNNQPAAIISTNMNCKKMATEQDFFQLRKKMAAAPSEDEMIMIAQKAFRLKCYSTQQLRNLTVLLLNEEGRYRFLDVAYSGVSDQHNYKTLRNLLTEDYYLRRFDAMLR